MSEKNNIILTLKYKNFHQDDINWEIYSREVFDSIKIEEISEELHFKKEIYKKNINPFSEEEEKKDNQYKTLEKVFIDSWDLFKLKDLQKVAEYYEIPYKGKPKNKLIEKIIEFEEKEENCMKVYDREVKWNSMNKI